MAIYTNEEDENVKMWRKQMKREQKLKLKKMSNKKLNQKPEKNEYWR